MREIEVWYFGLDGNVFPGTSGPGDVLAWHRAVNLRVPKTILPQETLSRPLTGVYRVEILELDFGKELVSRGRHSDVLLEGTARSYSFYFILFFAIPLSKIRPSLLLLIFFLLLLPLILSRSRFSFLPIREVYARFSFVLFSRGIGG